MSSGGGVEGGEAEEALSFAAGSFAAGSLGAAASSLLMVAGASFFDRSVIALAGRGLARI